MTGDLVTKEYFGNIPVRVVQHDGVAAIPLIDIADGVGLDRSGLRKLLKRNERILGNYVLRVIMSSSQGDVETICMTRDGVVGILMKTDFGKMKDPDKQANVISFQKWAIDTLSKIISGEIIPVKREALEDLVRQHLQIADSMAQYAHVDRGIAASVALAHAETESGADLSWCKGLVRQERQQAPGYLTPTQIGEELGGLYARSVNKMLQELGYQRWTGGRWQPTEIGKAYGENIPFTVILRTGGSHSDYQLKWSPSIVEKLRDHLNGTRDAQAQLAATG